MSLLEDDVGLVLAEGDGSVAVEIGFVGDRRDRDVVMTGASSSTGMA